MQCLVNYQRWLRSLPIETTPGLIEINFSICLRVEPTLKWTIFVLPLSYLTLYGMLFIRIFILWTISYYFRTLFGILPHMNKTNKKKFSKRPRLQTAANSNRGKYTSIHSRKVYIEVDVPELKEKIKWFKKPFLIGYIIPTIFFVALGLLAAFLGPWYNSVQPRGHTRWCI